MMNNNDPGKYTKPKSPLILLPAIGIIVGCVILIVLLIVGRFGNKGNNRGKNTGKQEVKTEAKTQATTEATTEAGTEATTKAAAEGTTASRPAATETTESSTESTGQDGKRQLIDYTFMLDGENYQLPCDYSQFTRNGWVLPSYSNKKDTDSVVQGEEVFFTFKKNSLWFVAMACNTDNKPLELKDCKIVGISIKAEYGSDFTMAQGITLKSTSDEIQKAYGKPDYTQDYEDYTEFSYHTDSNAYRESIIFTQYKLTNRRNYNGVFMRKVPK